MNYSGALRRLSAFLIDCLVLIALYFTIGCIFSAPQLSALPMIGFSFFGSLLLTTWLYYALLESSSWQATAGKKLLGLKVTTLDGQRIGFFRATARFFSKFLSRFLFSIGFLMVLWTKKKQALHDKIARVIVVKK